MLFSFIERRDHGSVTLATVRVEPNGKAFWEGAEPEKMRKLLLSKTWELLGDRYFDEANLEHWEKLPEILTGSRLWVERVE